MIVSKPTSSQEGKITSIREADIEVGPTSSHSYAYKIAGFVSLWRYHNAASAKADARRDQRISGLHIDPIPEVR